MTICDVLRSHYTNAGFKDINLMDILDVTLFKSTVSQCTYNLLWDME